MSDKKEFVKEITNIEEDIAKWYTDIVKKADLADYTDTKGCIAIKPYGFAIWENIQKYMDNLFKKAAKSQEDSEKFNKFIKKHTGFDMDKVADKAANEILSGLEDMTKGK